MKVKLKEGSLRELILDYLGRNDLDGLATFVEEQIMVVGKAIAKNIAREEIATEYQKRFEVDLNNAIYALQEVKKNFPKSVD